MKFFLHKALKKILLIITINLILNAKKTDYKSKFLNNNYLLRKKRVVYKHLQIIV